MRRRREGTAETEQREIAIRREIGLELNFHVATVARVGDETPARGRAGFAGGEIVHIQRGDEAVGIDPGAE